MTPSQLLDTTMGMEITDKVKNEEDDFVYFVKWSAPTLSYSTHEVIKQNLQSKDVLIYRNEDPLHDSEKDHFIRLVFENKEKMKTIVENQEQNK